MNYIRNDKLSIRDIVLIGLLATLLKVSQVALSMLPNVEIVSLLILIFAFRLGSKRTVYISILFSILNVLGWGMSVATVGYFLVWSLYGVVCSMLKGFLKTNIRVATFLGLYGFIFGSLFAIMYIPLGWSYVFTYWVNGLKFDLIHCVSNFVLGLCIFKPLLKGFDNAYKYTKYTK